MHRHAIHEAGHAAACLLAGVEFDNVRLGGDDGQIYIPEKTTGDRCLFVLAAGAAAEQLFFGQALMTCRNDLRAIFNVLDRIEYKGDQAEAAARCIREAKKLLAPHTGLVATIAGELETRRKLSYEETRQLL